MKKSLLSLLAILGLTILTGSNANAVQLSGNTILGCNWEYNSDNAPVTFTIHPTTGTTCELTPSDKSLWDATFQMSYDYIQAFKIEPGVKMEAGMMNAMFADLRLVEVLDVNELDVSAVTGMVGAFVGVGNSGTGVDELDLSKWNTSNVTDMMNMFGESKIMKLVLSNSFDTRKVTSFTQMFYDSAFEELSLNFSTINATNMAWMFHSAKELKKLDISSFAMLRPSPIVIDQMFNKMGENVVGGTEIKLNETFGRPSDAEWAKYNFPQTSYDVVGVSGLLASSVPTSPDINAMLNAMAPGTAVTLALAGSVPANPVNPVNPVTPATPSTPKAPNSGAFTNTDSLSARSSISYLIAPILSLIAAVAYISKRKTVKHD